VDSERQRRLTLILALIGIAFLMVLGDPAMAEVPAGTGGTGG
jgi:hypothetical protein